MISWAVPGPGGNSTPLQLASHRGGVAITTERRASGLTSVSRLVVGVAERGRYACSSQGSEASVEVKPVPGPGMVTIITSGSGPKVPSLWVVLVMVMCLH